MEEIMEYTLENELLKVTVTSFGAQVKSVVRKDDGVEHMWNADPKVWGYHAPILFPYTGRVKDGVIEVRGRTLEAKNQHGFARNMEHALVYQNRDTLVLEIRENEDTMAVFPYRFRLLSAFTLEGDALRHTLTVENEDTEEFSFGIGYHPAFMLPFDERHSAEDYELRFSDMESPLCLGTAPKGLVNGKCYYLGANLRSLPLNEALFAEDSHCMVNLRSRTLGLYEKDSGRAVVCDIGDFPYTLIWSKPGLCGSCVSSPGTACPARRAALSGGRKSPPPRPLPPAKAGALRWPPPLCGKSQSCKQSEKPQAPSFEGACVMLHGK